MKESKNYLDCIVEKKSIKKNDIQISIPTYNSYEVTKKTILKLHEQKQVEFDILLIDNASTDYQKLRKDFPDLNYVLLKENTGSSGAQRIGAELAIENNYKYVIFSDNDALMLDNLGLKKMLDELQKNDAVAIVPKNIEDLHLGTRKKNVEEMKGPVPFHYLLTKALTLKKAGMHNFYYFLNGDDVSMSLKLLSAGKIVARNDVFFYHPIYKKSVFSYKTLFLCLRANLILLLHEDGISFKWKISIVHLFLFTFFQTFAKAVIFRDIFFIKLICAVSRHFLKKGYQDMEDMHNIISEFPEDKYKVFEIEMDAIGKNELKYFKNIFSYGLWFLRGKGKYFSNFQNKEIYLILKKT